MFIYVYTIMYIHMLCMYTVFLAPPSSLAKPVDAPPPCRKLSHSSPRRSSPYRCFFVFRFFFQFLFFCPSFLACSGCNDSEGFSFPAFSLPFI